MRPKELSESHKKLANRKICRIIRKALGAAGTQYLNPEPECTVPDPKPEYSVAVPDPAFQIIQYPKDFQAF